MTYSLPISNTARAFFSTEPDHLNDPEGICESPLDSYSFDSIPSREAATEPTAAYASRLFSEGNDGASGAGPGYAENEAPLETEFGPSRGLWEFFAVLIPLFSLSGCGGEESVNPAPTVPCTPKEEWGQGGGGGSGGSGGSGGGEAWLCPDYPDDRYYNPDATGEPGSEG